LNRPTGDDTITVPNLVSKNEAAARLALETLGLTHKSTGSGAEVAAQDPPPGAQVSTGSKVTITLKTPVVTTEQMVSMTLSGSLKTDPGRQHEIYQLLSLLAEAVDGSASHIQMTAKITVAKDKAAELVEQAEEADAQQVTATDI
jgi:beta-lactam-binding protein with PASTA domain